MPRGVVVVLAALMGCKGGADDVQSSDVRLDGLGDDAIDSSGTRMCVDGQGIAYVAWVDDRDGTPDVWLRSSADGGSTWPDDPVRVDHGEGAVFAPALACADDRVYVVWEDDRDGELENHNIYLNHSSDGGRTWLDDDLLLDDDLDGRTMSLGPSITAVADRVHVAWFDSTSGAYDIYVASSPNGGESFLPPVRADSDDAGSAYSAWPQVGTDGAGQVYVTWVDSRDELSDVYFARSVNNGSTFEPDRRLDSGDGGGAHDSFAARMGVEGQLIYVVWHDERNGDGRDVYMNWSADGGATWAGEAVRVDSDGPGMFDSINAQVVVAGGAAHIAWQDARNIGYDAYYRRAVDGAFAAEEVRLDLGDSPGFGNSVNPVVVVDGDDVAVVWQDHRYDGEGIGYNDLYYNWSGDGGLTFATADLRLDSVEPGSKFTEDVTAAIDGGVLLAAWTDGRGGNQDVYFHALDLGEQAEYIPVDP